MFRFLHSIFDRDDGVEAVPLLPEEDPAPSTQASRLIDINSMVVQASSRVPVGRLRKMGKKVVSLLSRRKIDELVNKAIKRYVDRTPQAAALVNSAAGEPANAAIRKEFDTLLSQYLGSVLDGEAAPDRPAFEVVDGRLQPELTLEGLELEPGRGLHVETMSLCAAGRLRSTGEPVLARQRNAFLQVAADDSTRRILRQLELGFVTHGDAGYIVGDPAIELGRIFGQTARRPMQQGTLSPDEPVALFILSLLLRQVVGSPGKPGEICVYSVPADPLEADRNFIYHRGALESALKALGFTPRPMVESHLLVSSELKDQDYTGVGVSFGAGMITLGISYKGLPSISFSMFRGSDWIDLSAAEALGMSVDEVARIREGDMDLREPQGRVEGAIAIYTRTLLQSVVEALKQKLNDAHALPNFGRPIPVVCSGTPATAKGFLELFKEEIEPARLPLRIDYLRLAEDPSGAVAQGCLQAALEETRAQGDAGQTTAPAVLERAAIVGPLTRDLPSLSRFRKPKAG